MSDFVSIIESLKRYLEEKNIRDIEHYINMRQLYVDQIQRRCDLWEEIEKVQYEGKTGCVKEIEPHNGLVLVSFNDRTEEWVYSEELEVAYNINARMFLDIKRTVDSVLHSLGL